MREPSDVARKRCSFTQTIDEFTKLTPAVFIAAPFKVSRNWILISRGTSNGSFSNALFQFASTRATGARVTRFLWNAEFARAMSTAACVTRRISSAVTMLLAAKPQVPLTSTRTPKPKFWLRATFCICCSRVAIDSER